MTSEIFVTDLEIFARHGVYDSEHTSDQRFLISVSAKYDADNAMLSDDINAAVNYAEMVAVIENAVKSHQFSLIERLAKCITDEIFKKFENVTLLSVTVKKFPNDMSAYRFGSVGFSSTFSRNESFLSLGSNIGDRLQFLKLAAQMLSANSAISVKKLSNVYETAPQNFEKQPFFLNCAIKVSTSLSPYNLMKACQDVEKKIGKNKTTMFGPRNIDIDILTFNNESIDSENVKIPHQRMFDRNFVMIPLKEILKGKMIYGHDIDSCIKKNADQAVTFFCGWQEFADVL